MTARTNTEKRSEGNTLGLFLIVCLCLLLAVCFVFQSILVPIAIGLVVSYLLTPAVEWACRRSKLPRKVIVIMTMGAFLLVFTLGLITFAPSVYREVGALIELAPTAYHRFLRTWLPVFKNFVVDYQIMTKAQFETVYESITVGSKFYEAFQDTVKTLWRTAPKVFGTVVHIFLMPLVSYMFLQYAEVLKESFYSLVPKRSLRASKEIFFRLNQTLRGVVKGQVYVASTLGVLYMAGFSFVGLKAGAAIGLVCGIARLVPYLDIVVGVFLSSIVLVSSFSGWPMVIAVALVILVVQLLDGMFITPKLIGRNAGLHPVVVICSIIAFSGLLGFGGVLIAIPTVAVFKESFKIFAEYYKDSKFYGR